MRSFHHKILSRIMGYYNNLTNNLVNTLVNHFVLFTNWNRTSFVSTSKMKTCMISEPFTTITFLLKTWKILEMQKSSFWATIFISMISYFAYILFLFETILAWWSLLFVRVLFFDTSCLFCKLFLSPVHGIGKVKFVYKNCFYKQRKVKLKERNYKKKCSPWEIYSRSKERDFSLFMIGPWFYMKQLSHNILLCYCNNSMRDQV